MNDTAQKDNALIRPDAAVPAVKPESPALIYDADARNRFEFDVREGVKKYETAHVFDRLEDLRYMQWLREFKLTGNEDDVSEESREASVRLWDDIIFTVERIKYPEGSDFRTLIPQMEKIEALNAFLSVAIGADIVQVDGDRILGGDTTQTVVTEAFFNGQIVTQTHELQQSNFEFQKKYARIQGKRFQEEKVGGLRGKPKVKYFPQDHKIGELYDEMAVSQTGFAGGIIPLRFKTTVIHHLFGERLSQKKSPE